MTDNVMCETDGNVEYIYSPLAADPDLGELVDMFVDEMPGRVASLLDRFNRRDWDGLQQSVHQLKGAAGSYGFAAISPCAGKLENAIQHGEPEAQIREAVTELVRLCNRVRCGQPSASGHLCGQGPIASAAIFSATR